MVTLINGSLGVALPRESDPSVPADTPASVIHELRVENLLLIERAELRLADGLNVLTGETGAGKTVLAHALDLLLGGRARTGSPPTLVRPGAAEAYVEGVFALPKTLEGERGELLPADAEEVVLARRIGADGRTRAQINGRTVAVADLRRLGTALLTFYGQHEHRKLTLAAAQLEILDGCCGPEQAARRAACAAAHREVRELRERAEQLRELQDARERELDLLEHELAEIEEAAPQEGEPERLRAERERLRQPRRAARRRGPGGRGTRWWAGLRRSRHARRRRVERPGHRLPGGGRRRRPPARRARRARPRPRD